MLFRSKRPTTTATASAGRRRWLDTAAGAAASARASAAAASAGRRRWLDTAVGAAVFQGAFHDAFQGDTRAGLPPRGQILAAAVEQPLLEIEGEHAGDLTFPNVCEGNLV